MNSACDDYNWVLSNRFGISADCDLINWQSANAPRHDFSLVVNALALIVDRCPIFLPAWRPSLGPLHLLISWYLIKNGRLSLIRVIIFWTLGGLFGLLFLR
jgi:hypothetical protein